jgi:hypothetical protein
MHQLESLSGESVATFCKVKVPLSLIAADAQLRLELRLAADTPEECFLVSRLQLGRNPTTKLCPIHVNLLG